MASAIVLCIASVLSAPFLGVEIGVVGACTSTPAFDAVGNILLSTQNC